MLMLMLHCSTCIEEPFVFSCVASLSSVFFPLSFSLEGYRIDTTVEARKWRFFEEFFKERKRERIWNVEDFIYIYISVVCNASFFFVSRRESLGEIEEFFRFGGGGDVEDYWLIIVCIYLLLAKWCNIKDLWIKYTCVYGNRGVFG